MQNWIVEKDTKTVQAKIFAQDNKQKILGSNIFGDSPSNFREKTFHRKNEDFSPKKNEKDIFKYNNLVYKTENLNFISPELPKPINLDQIIINLKPHSKIKPLSQKRLEITNSNDLKDLRESISSDSNNIIQRLRKIGHDS